MTTMAGEQRERQGIPHQRSPPSTSTSISTSSAIRARATITIIVRIIIVVVARGIVTVSAAAATSEHGAVLTVLDAWLQPGVEARPAVEVGAADHNWLVGHRHKANGAWEPPIITSQESLLIIAVGVIVIVSLQSKLLLESLPLWR
jgi:hypothetical protein